MFIVPGGTVKLHVCVLCLLGGLVPLLLLLEPPPVLLLLPPLDLLKLLQQLQVQVLVAVGAGAAWNNVVITLLL